MIEAVWVVFAFSLGIGVRLIGLPPLIGYLAAGFVIAASGDYLDVTVESTQAGITLIPWSRGHWYFGGARLNCPLCDEHRQRSNPLDVGANSFWHSPAAPIDLSLGRLQRPRRTAGLAGPEDADSICAAGVDVIHKTFSETGMQLAQQVLIQSKQHSA